MGTDSTDCYPHYYDSKSGAHFTCLIDFLDGPVSMPHNFYLYYDGTHRFNYIKWDLNECFGVFRRLGNIQLDITRMQQLDPFTNNNLNPGIYFINVDGLGSGKFIKK